MILTNLADVVRRSGLHVVEVDGWRGRGHGQLVAVDSITAHHTATPNSLRGDYPTMNTIINGRSGLPGPLAQLGLGRSGIVYVIAAGLCWHAGATFHTWQNNWHAIGIEAEHPGGSTSWPPAQYAAYVRLAHALHLGYGVPVNRIVGHKEIASPLGRKNDPTFSMDAFRAAVARTSTEGEDVTVDELMNEHITRKNPETGEVEDFGSLRGVLWTLMARTSDDDTRLSRIESKLNDLAAKP